MMQPVLQMHAATRAECTLLIARSMCFAQCLLATQVQGQKAYVTNSTEPPVNLAAYKHARAMWDGTDNGVFQAWLHDRNFAPVSSY